MFDRLEKGHLFSDSLDHVHNNRATLMNDCDFHYLNREKNDF